MVSVRFEGNAASGFRVQYGGSIFSTPREARLLSRQIGSPKPPIAQFPPSPDNSLLYKKFCNAPLYLLSGNAPALVSLIEQFTEQLGIKWWPMKSKNTIRMQLVGVGFAAALFLASAAPAQEITNTDWQDRPGATEPLQVAANQTANTANATVADAGASNVAASPSSAPSIEEAAIAQPAAQGNSVTFWLLSTVAAALYVLAELKRLSRNFAPRVTHADRSISLS